jgi:hypothetical protein
MDESDNVIDTFDLKENSSTTSHKFDGLDPITTYHLQVIGSAIQADDGVTQYDIETPILTISTSYTDASFVEDSINFSSEISSPKHRRVSASYKVASGDVNVSSVELRDEDGTVYGTSNKLEDTIVATDEIKISSDIGDTLTG